LTRARRGTVPTFEREHLQLLTGTLSAKPRLGLRIELARLRIAQQAPKVAKRACASRAKVALDLRRRKNSVGLRS